MVELVETKEIIPASKGPADSRPPDLLLYASMLQSNKLSSL
jgi:hypothetical protein